MRTYVPSLLLMGIKTLAPILATLSNEFVYYGFPKTWILNTITPIHKEGDPMDPGNYRTIMIGHVMSKIYALMLHGEVSAIAKV